MRMPMLLPGEVVDRAVAPAITMLPSIKLPINGARIEVLRKTEHTAMHGRGVDHWWMQTPHKGLVCFDFIKVWILEICTAITNLARC